MMRTGPRSGVSSKIARGITEPRLIQEKQRLLYGEMQRRVKNLFSLSASIVSLTVSRYALSHRPGR